MRAEVDGGRTRRRRCRPRERVLEVYDAPTRERLGRAPAGVGPTHVVAGSGGLAYVVDTTGDGLLVFETRPQLRLTRRLPLPGAPYGSPSDPVNRRLWVTLTATNRARRAGRRRPAAPAATLPGVRQPDAVAVDPARPRLRHRPTRMASSDPRRARYSTAEPRTARR